MSTEVDSYAKSLHDYKNLEFQVNNVVSGKAPDSLDIAKILTRPMVYIPALFLVTLIALWLLNPGFVRNEKKKLKIGLLVIISIIVSGGLSLGLFFWLRRKKK